MVSLGPSLRARFPSVKVCRQLDSFADAGSNWNRDSGALRLRRLVTPGSGTLCRSARGEAPKGAKQPKKRGLKGWKAPCTQNRKGLADLSAKPLKLLAPGAGFEPATNRLTVDCSTAELSGTDGGRIAATFAGCKPFATQHAGKSSSWARAAFSLWLSCRFRLRTRPPCGYRRRYGDHARVISRKASWRSGYAEDCKSLHPGSIPGEASKLFFMH